MSVKTDLKSAPTANQNIIVNDDDNSSTSSSSSSSSSMNNINLAPNNQPISIDSKAILDSTHASVSNEVIIKAFQALKEQQDLLAEVKVLNSSKAEEKAQELAKISKACRDNLLSTVKKKGVDLKKILKQSEPPFPLVYRLIEMLGQPEIQNTSPRNPEMALTVTINSNPGALKEKELSS